MNPSTDYLTRLIAAINSPDEAEIALPWLRTLAGALHLPLTFVYVLDPARTGQAEGVAHAIAGDFLRILAADSRLARLDVQTQLVVGRAAEQLPRLTQDQPGARLVLVRGGEDADGDVVGSETEEVIRALTTPFIVIPPLAAPPPAIRSIVVGNDRSELAENVLRTSQTVGLSLGVTVIAVEAIEPGTVSDDAFLQVEPSITERQVRVRGLASRTLLATARARDAALIVVGAQGAGTSEASVMGRTTDWLTRHADRPVVVVPRRGNADQPA